MILTEEYLYFVDRALDGMVGIVTELGDDVANRRPELPGANSPYAVLTHCLGVMEYWAGHILAGRPDDRNREAEFVATGSVDELVARTRLARLQLESDIRRLEPFAAPSILPPGPPNPAKVTQGSVLMHVFEELAQHLGQMQVCRDVLLASGGPLHPEGPC